MVLIAVATLAGATLQSSAGFGFALVVSPALFAAYDPAPAILAVLTLSAILNLLILAGEERSLRVRLADLAVVLAAAIPGLAIGVVILHALSKPPLQIVVGVCVVAGALAQARRGRRVARQAGTSLRVGTGLVCGALTTTTGTNGPPMVLMLHRSGASPAELRDTMAAMLISLDVVGVAALYLGGSDPDLPGAGFLALLVALTTLGHAIGRQVFERLRPEAFAIVALALVVAAGCASVAAGVTG